MEELEKGEVPSYRLIRAPKGENGVGVPVKAWVEGVALEEAAHAQLLNVARLPFVFRWVAAMPDVHWGMGATVGSVIPTQGAIIPAAVGVDIGCGMMAVETTLTARDLPDTLAPIRSAIEEAVPHGRTDHGGRTDRGGWGNPPEPALRAWKELEPRYEALCERHPRLAKGQRINHVRHLGTLGTGNHFIELCTDERDHIWLMLHSGSRGVGNRIGTYFIELAKDDARRLGFDLPDQDLAYFSEGARHFDDYVAAVGWAQEYALENRRLMMDAVIDAVRKSKRVPKFTATQTVANCHHNYVAVEEHYGETVFVTRKGAVRAGLGELGIIPGSMGTASYIVSGKGNPESFSSCSHGAGRAMSRGEAKRRFSIADHAEATRGVECRKDAGVIDETPGAYKPIDKVMEAQKDLVTVVHTLKQLVCVKG